MWIRDSDKPCVEGVARPHLVKLLHRKQREFLHRAVLDKQNRMRTVPGNHSGAAFLCQLYGGLPDGKNAGHGAEFILSLIHI